MWRVDGSGMVRWRNIIWNSNERGSNFFNMKHLLAFSILLISSPQIANSDSKSGEQIPEIGDQVNSKWVGRSRELCVTHSAQLDPCFEHSFNGIRFTVAYNDGTKKISYVSTMDQKFMTADALRIGSEIDVSSDTVIAFPGWQIFARPSADGWWPVIGFADTVKLKDGTVLKLWNKQGSERGTAVVEAFAKGHYLTP